MGQEFFVLVLLVITFPGRAASCWIALTASNMGLRALTSDCHASTAPSLVWLASEITARLLASSSPWPSSHRHLDSDAWLLIQRDERFHVHGAWLRSEHDYLGQLVSVQVVNLSSPRLSQQSHASAAWKHFAFQSVS